MAFLFELILASGWFFLAYRSFKWFRDKRAEHRAMWERFGYVERNKDRRLRGDKYNRIAAISYAVSSAAVFLVMHKLTEHAHPLLSFVVSWIGSAFLALLPAGFISGIYATYMEWSHPRGDISLLTRDNQMWIPGQAVRPEGGQFGTSQILDAVKEGLTNPTGLFIRRHRIAEPEVMAK